MMFSGLQQCVRFVCHYSIKYGHFGKTPRTRIARIRHRWHAILGKVFFVVVGIRGTKAMFSQCTVILKSEVLLLLRISIVSKKASSTMNAAAYKLGLSFLVKGLNRVSESSVWTPKKNELISPMNNSPQG